MINFQLLCGYLFAFFVDFQRDVFCNFCGFNFDYMPRYF